MRPAALAHGSLLLSLVVLAAAVTRIPATLDTAYTSLTASSESTSQRELAPAAAIQVPTELLVNAARVIPRGAVYTVVVGDAPPTTPTLHVGVPQVLRYWLLPRRYTGTVPEAEWVIAYHQSPEALGVGIARRIELGPDAAAVEVSR